MTPITTARPTIVRTSPPPVEPAACAGAESSERFRRVLSPSAARAAGASRKRPSTAVPADLKAGVIRITGGGESGQDSTPSSAGCGGSLAGNFDYLPGQVNLNCGWVGWRGVSAWLVGAVRARYACIDNPSRPN